MQQPPWKGEVHAPPYGLLLVRAAGGRSGIVGFADLLASVRAEEQTRAVAFHTRALALMFCLLALVLVACGGDDGGDGGGSGEVSPPPAEPPPPEPPPPPSPQSGCEDTTDQPTRVAANPPGYVVACSATTGSSLSVRNVSSQVLRIRPGASSGEMSIVMSDTSSSAGDQAATSVTGSGWDVNHETFVLPLGASLVANGGAPVAVSFAPDLRLSAQALTARYAAEWVVSKLQTRGRALGQRVATCATSASGVVESGARAEDILRSALGTQGCVTLVNDVLRDERVAEPVADDLGRARRQILNFAKPVLQDEFISRVVRLLAK